jgi:hypothetical protein
LTRRRVSADVHVVGPLRYIDYTGILPDSLRSEARMKLGVAQERPLVGIFTQALWEIDGYARQWTDFISVLAQRDDDPVVIVRRHPRDGVAPAAGLQRDLTSAGLAVADASNLSVEQILCACDLVCSAFSSVATDLCYLQRQAEAPLGVPAFLLFAPDLREHFARQCGFSVHPLVKAGLVLEADTPGALGGCVARALDPATRGQVWQGCRGLMAPANAAELVIDRLRSDWLVRSA